ncbi:MAG: alanine dehydrogenase [Cryomorphaceae bacterium]|nr:alanine dehydrogenase [Cryomorphaceae bacterium]
MNPEYASLAWSLGQYLPQEETLEIARHQRQLFIGIPKETRLQEKRVSLIPDAVALLTAHGHRVLVETGAGEGAKFSDHDYSEAGAEIAYDRKAVFASDIIVKVEPPSNEELNLMKHKQLILSAIQLKARNKSFFENLMRKKATAISFEGLLDEQGQFAIVRAMSEIAGNTAVLIAAEYLSNVNSGKGYMMGGVSGIPPTNIVILGAGTVGSYAARAALGLGASVKVFDKSILKLRRLQELLHMPVYTSVINPGILSKSIANCDVLIGALRPENGRSPCVVTEEMVKKMSPGSVIIDVSIDSGGCIETSELCTHDRPTVTKHGVIHYGVPNIPSRVSRTASFALSNILTPLLLDTANRGGVEETLRSNLNLQKGLYMYNGVLTSKVIGEWHNLPYSAASLLLGGI